MEGERAAVHVRWGGGADEGARRTSKRAFRKRISSLHPHKEKYVIAGRQHYFGLLEVGGGEDARLGRFNKADEARRCMYAAAGASPGNQQRRQVELLRVF